LSWAAMIGVPPADPSAQVNGVKVSGMVHALSSPRCAAGDFCRSSSRIRSCACFSNSRAMAASKAS
jgi:hypothetical protein